MSRSGTKRGRVLIVDDQRLNVQLLSDILKDHYDLSIAGDGERAIELCARRPPDLVLLDVQMPGLDGYEVCRRLKADPATREIPVIFVTARDSVEDQIKGLEAGAVDFITKPVHAPIVRARTRTHILLKQHADRLRELAHTDTLTGVANRRSFDDRLKTEWRRCQRSQSPIALIMIDVDHFKQYNDTYGHQAGDQCLARVSAAMKGCLRRPGDMLSRYGGEEFACLLPETGLGQAMRKAEELGESVQALAIAHASSAAGPIVTISRGVAALVP
ncbi:MAG: diguanylate cyclase domain-containing protein, partial [Burkholderiales bacterium]